MGCHDRFSTLEEKIRYLLRHLGLLTGKVDKKKIVTAMKHDGLISKKTYWPDVDLDEAIRQAKLRWYASHQGREINA